MNGQLTIFTTGILCNHCGKDPGRSERNAQLWHGFRDLDTKEHCCWNCRRQHYFLKQQTQYRGLMAEMPVVAVA